MLRGSTVSAAARRVVGATAGAVLIATGLLGCSASDVDREPAPSASASARPSTSPGASPSPSPRSAPTLMPDGTADDNLPLFTAVTAKVWASSDRLRGRAYVDALAAAGFPKERMQVTHDLTTVGRAVESLQFSVAWGEDACLIGQVGPSTGEPVTAVMPQLAEGRCLVGSTRPIDW
ncbi:hypothetical protein Q9R19_06875 [Microbacterium sp. ARD32]|uniref:DUF6993 domain-containing protein n=1 Tax=Microbacterium sp. ARD32 TaxID=2962577 RepID=UPI0028816B42|nr:hypothetical protein [Microbacterium sp. ARD32]MDT0157341.1 hypothetical protein [Microbacterium sp. ARD32]